MDRQLTIPGLEAQMGQTLGDDATRNAIKAQDNRVALLEALYEQDDRGRDDYPLHHTYTGLVDSFRCRLGQSVIDVMTAPCHWGTRDWEQLADPDRLRVAFWLEWTAPCQ